MLRPVGGVWPGREKRYWLKIEDWGLLRTWTKPEGFPRWIDWPRFFTVQEQVIAVLQHECGEQGLVGSLTRPPSAVAGPRAKSDANPFLHDCDAEFADEGREPPIPSSAGLLTNMVWFKNTQFPHF